MMSAVIGPSTSAVPSTLREPTPETIRQLVEVASEVATVGESAVQQNDGIAAAAFVIPGVHAVSFHALTHLIPSLAWDRATVAFSVPPSGF